jgi:hypothetical protein
MKLKMTATITVKTMLTSFRCATQIGVPFDARGAGSSNRLLYFVKERSLLIVS